MSSNSSDGSYILGTSDRELERLGFQHRVWIEQTTRLWEQAGFSSEKHIIDLGCGPGFASLDLAQRVGGAGKILAVDHSEKYLSFLHAQIRQQGLKHVVANRMDVEHELETSEHWDGVFARWVLCFLKDPEAVVHRVSKVLKPGGTFAIMDYFNYKAAGLYPENETSRMMFDAFYKSVLQHGGSYDIGAQGPRLLREHHFEITFMEPVCRVGGPASPLWKWLASFVNSFLPILIESDLLTPSDATKIQSDFNSPTADPNALFFAPPVMLIVGQKP